ncbi:MAG: hypothetical protein RLO18_09440, partial [Gimesia chilikensis]
MMKCGKFLILLMSVIGLTCSMGLSDSFAQNENKTDPLKAKQDGKTETEEESAESSLPKIEEMQLPSVEDLLKKR